MVTHPALPLFYSSQSIPTSAYYVTLQKHISHYLLFCNPIHKKNEPLLNKLTTNFQIHHPNNGGERMNWKRKEFYG